MSQESAPESDPRTIELYGENFVIRISGILYQIEKIEVEVRADDLVEYDSSLPGEHELDIQLSVRRLRTPTPVEDISLESDSEDSEVTEPTGPLEQ